MVTERKERPIVPGEEVAADIKRRFESGGIDGSTLLDELDKLDQRDEERRDAIFVVEALRDPVIQIAIEGTDDERDYWNALSRSLWHVAQEGWQRGEVPIAERIDEAIEAAERAIAVDGESLLPWKHYLEGMRAYADGDIEALDGFVERDDVMNTETLRFVRRKLSERLQKERIDQQVQDIDSSDLLKSYPASYLGKGAEHMVFAIDGHPNVVAKVDAITLRKVVMIHSELKKPFDKVDDQFKEAARGMLAADREETRELAEYFPGSTLKERPIILTIPVTRELLAEALTDQDPAVQLLSEGVQDVATIVRIQERAPEAALGTRAASFRFAYTEEQGEVDMDRYKAMNESLVDGVGDIASELVGMAVSQETQKLLDASDKDPQLAAVLEDFVEKAVAYMTDTKKGLDLAGPHNVSVYMDEEEWKYVLLDAKYGTPDILSYAQEAVQVVRAGGELSHELANRLMNVLGMVRVINATAIHIGSEVRLHVFDEPITDVSEELYRQMKKYTKSYLDAPIS